MKDKMKFTVKTTKGFRFKPPKKQPDKIKVTSSIYDVFKDFESKK